MDSSIAMTHHLTFMCCFKSLFEMLTKIIDLKCQYVSEDWLIDYSDFVTSEATCAGEMSAIAETHFTSVKDENRLQLSSNFRNMHSQHKQPKIKRHMSWQLRPEFPNSNILPRLQSAK